MGLAFSIDLVFGGSYRFPGRGRGDGAHLIDADYSLESA